jgi:hypothetical protein
VTNFLAWLTRQPDDEEAQTGNSPETPITPSSSAPEPSENAGNTSQPSGPVPDYHQVGEKEQIYDTVI